MVIGFDGSRAFQEGRTGTENYSYQLLKALAKIDEKNSYIIYIRPTYYSTIVEQNVVWPKSFQFKVIKWPKFWTQGGLALQTFKDRLDVLFVPAHTLPVIRKPGLKTAVTVHDLGSEYLPALHLLKQRLYLGFTQKHQLKSATKIIAVSKATKEDLVKRAGIDPDKVTVVYEGYDRDNFQSFDYFGFAQYRFAQDRFSIFNFQRKQTIKKYNLQYQNYFLFVGTVQPRKNLIRLIAAYSQLLSEQLRTTQNTSGSDSLINRNSDSSGSPSPSESFRNESFRIPKLAIAGSKGWLADEIYKLPKQLGIEDQVKFLGYVPDKDLPALYSGAIALVFPSLFEGFGLPILEAQACGCPVLTSNISSMPEVAGQGAIYVNPYSESDIVKGMTRIMNHESRIKLIKAGLKNIKRFSWEKCAAQTLEVLESL